MNCVKNDLIIMNDKTAKIEDANEGLNCRSETPPSHVKPKKII